MKATVISMNTQFTIKNESRIIATLITLILDPFLLRVKIYIFFIAEV